MEVRGVTPILNVSDIRASIDWFALVGWDEHWTYPEGDDEPGFGGVRSNGAQIFLCRNAQGSRDGRRPTHPGDDDTGGVWMSWWLDTPGDVDAAHAGAVANGLEVTWPPTDEPWGVREFHLRHPDGHMFRVGSGLPEESG
jgi:uncharacterized glyoxalase superfamily protein PhnB